MRKFVLVVLVFVVGIMFFTSCRKLDVAPAPEVEIIDFTPLGVYSFPGDTVPCAIDSVYFKVWNYVDARVTEMDYRFLGVKNDSAVTQTYCTNLNVFLDGGDEGCDLSNVTILYGLVLESEQALNYMYSENDNTVAEIIFRGVDNYTGENTFSCKMYFSLLQMPEVPFFHERKMLQPIAGGGSNE